MIKNILPHRNIDLDFDYAQSTFYVLPKANYVKTSSTSFLCIYVVLKKLFFLFTLFYLLFSCEEGRKKTPLQGGKITFAIHAKPTTWIPSLAFDVNTMTVLSQIYEGLVEIDQQTYQVKPLLAKNIETSHDFRTYTFELNPNVHFHPNSVFKSDSTDVLTNNDVIKTFEFACSKKYHESSYAYQNILKDIQGATEFHHGEMDTIKGLFVENGKIVIRLKNQDPQFLQKLASPTLGIFSAKWLEKQKGIPPGTGPFYCRFEDEQNINLVRHEQYFNTTKDGQPLPYLDELTFKVYAQADQKITDFLDGKLDIVNGLNAPELNVIFEKRKSDFNKIPPKLVYFSNPLLKTTMILFNLNTPLLEPTANRKMLNYAINRTEINRKIIHDQLSTSTVFALNPPIEKLFNHYDYQQLKKESLRYNPDKIKVAKNLKDFEKDTLTLNILNDPQRIKLAKLIKAQLKKELGLELVIQLLTIEEMGISIQNMDADMYLINLSAEYLNPLSIMKHFYGATVPDSLNVPSTVNFSRYKNWYYDQFYEKASKEFKSAKQFEAILLAEKELLKNPPFIVLHYNSDNYIHYAYVCNLHSNLLNLISFKEIYIKK